jgi:hypothetical protein
VRFGGSVPRPRRSLLVVEVPKVVILSSVKDINLPLGVPLGGSERCEAQLQAAKATGPLVTKPGGFKCSSPTCSKTLSLKKKGGVGSCNSVPSRCP